MTTAIAPTASADTLDPLIATGRLVNEAGTSLAGAHVELMMWPSDDVLENQVEGDAVNLVSVASGTTAADGVFGLRLPDVDALLNGAGVDDIVDFTVVATSPDGEVAHYAFSREVLTQTVDGVLRTVVVDPVDVIDGVVRDLLTDPITALLNALSPGILELVRPEKNLLLHLGDAGENTTADVAGALSQVPEIVEEVTPEVEDTALTDKSCFSILETKYAPRNALVGQHGSWTSLVDSDFIYSQGQSTTFGVGFSASGKFGTFKSSGSSSKESSATVGFAAKAGAGYWGRRTQWVPAKYSIWCSGSYGAASKIGYEVRTYSYAGGATTASWGSSQLPSATKCVPHEKGSWFSKATSTAINWSNGFDTSGPIGIDLSARTGYSSSAQAKFGFTRGAGRLCGTVDYPAGTPRILVAKAR